MIDREVPRVRPPYRLEFLDVSEFAVSGWKQEEGEVPTWQALPFFDRDTGKARFAVIDSEDKRLISDVASVVRFNRPVSEQEVVDEVRKNSSRRASASIIYSRSGEKAVVCDESSCRFHFEKGCLNPIVVIDDSPGDSWCLTYELKEG